MSKIGIRKGAVMVRQLTGNTETFICKTTTESLYDVITEHEGIITFEVFGIPYSVLEKDTISEVDIIPITKHIDNLYDPYDDYMKKLEMYTKKWMKEGKL